MARGLRTLLSALARANGLRIVKFHNEGFAASWFVQAPDGRCAYMSVSDVRGFPREWAAELLIRDAANTDDYHGGVNRYTSLDQLPFIFHAFAQGANVCYAVNSAPAINWSRPMLRMGKTWQEATGYWQVDNTGDIVDCAARSQTPELVPMW